MRFGELGLLRSIFTVVQKRKLLRLRIGGLQNNLAVIKLGEEPRVLGGLGTKLEDLARSSERKRYRGNSGIVD